MGPTPTARTNVVAGSLVFAALLAVYHLNGDFLPGNDATPNVYLPVSLLNEGNLTFSPPEAPFMFHWALQTPRGWARIPFIRSFDEDPRMPQLYANGTLIAERPQYYLLPTRQPGEFVGQYGPGAGLTALPVFAVLHVVSGNLMNQPRLLWFAAKFVAAAAVAGSAVFLYLLAMRFVPRRQALLITALYGLGTCVWSLGSQTLWQHGPNLLFLAMGTYYLIRAGERRRYAALCAVAYAAAVVCRPTSALYILAAGGYLVIVHRKTLWTFVLAGLPIGIAFAAFNSYFLGSPLDFGQAERGKAIAQYKTGSDEVWRWSSLPGNAAGQLVSPSRGLLVFSPFVVFSAWGAWRVWRDRTYVALRPVTVALVLTFLVTFAWFDWWGGWSFGPRLLVDTMPLLAALLMPVVGWIFQSRRRLTVFLVLGLWSVFAQVVGAFAYDLEGWNALKTYEILVEGEREPRLILDGEEARRLTDGGAKLNRVIAKDVDRPEYRHRLWSIADNPIVYYTTHFRQARQAKREMMRAWIR